MVTANRRKLGARAVRCFEQQTYAAKELVIIDDGDQDYSALFNNLPPAQVRYIRDVPKGLVLGSLRNLALEAAAGEYLIQWDDDDWYHPERIQVQAQILARGYDACCLSTSLMHINEPAFRDAPFTGSLPDGIPGSIMHRRSTDIRYPETRKAEDTHYLQSWMKRRYYKLPETYAHLFMRCYHGDNTWALTHFRRRLRNSLPNALRYYWYSLIRNDLRKHPAFRLSAANREAFKSYKELSESLGLL
ncbi:Glycosyltransferase involved in cell wall bisynthesis [Cyclonatronum proteinivorum]|uniref:Glycosyltransferase involved in cell wall bisynthesis n=2 Tax=Cyclonatronum proteinivorum TaxID=1457365 RepID=A0A345UN51_9BACT|nr:Glycosyltransferase involved in cell wall bisynthesis [Cyclonatronum proteinivorum]